MKNWKVVGREILLSINFSKFRATFFVGSRSCRFPHAALPIIQNFTYLQSQMPSFTVIPTCADLARFKQINTTCHSSELTIGYVGTASNW